MRLLSSPATASLAISVGGNTAGLAVRYHDVSFASTHHHCRFSACKGRRSVIQAAVMRSEIVKTAAGSRPRPAPWPRGTAPPTCVCFLVRVSLVFRRTQCFAENVWVKAANVSKSSHLRHLNLLFLLGVLLVATEGGLFYLNANVFQFGFVPNTRWRWRNQRLRLCCCRKVLRHPAAAFECERGGGYDSRGLPARGSCGWRNCTSKWFTKKTGAQE